MTHAIVTADDYAIYVGGRSLRRILPGAISGAVVLAISAGLAAWLLESRPAAVARTDAAPAILVPAYVALLDPSYSLGPAPISFEQSSPLAASLQASGAPAAPVQEPEAVPPLPLRASAVLPELVQDMPLPAPRPPELRARAGLGSGRAWGRPMMQARASVSAAPAPDNRSFFERIFGVARPSGPMLAYAAPEDGLFGKSQPMMSSPATPDDRRVAIYDIAAHTVYMPDGTTLEAHSGLGERLDDPRHVDERNRGATPPHVYELELRAQLFHGVRALRLKPVGNGGVFGRAGLLAHTYMLGPNGDSNGCVSFKNYTAFLQAYLSGSVSRLVVVTRRS